jgi:LacI family transcriptional regulator
MAGRRQPRLRELANDLGVSITTVSRALAGYSDVSEATRARVTEAARARGYVPSRVGRMLVSGRTDFIGMVLPVRDGHLMDSFLGEFVAGLSEGLTARGRDLFIATAARLNGEADVVRHMIDGDRADAIVLNRTEIDDPRIHVLLSRQFPFVAHGRILTAPNDFAWFDTDGTAAFADAARMLIELGHQRFGLVTINEPFTFARLRQQGLEEALTQAGLTLPDSAVRPVPMMDEAAAVAAAGELLSGDDRPTAVFGITDAQAIAVLKAATAHSMSVPDDLSVIGFDDLPIAAYAQPALSTFDQHARESAAVIAGMVTDMLDKGPQAVTSRLIKPEFTARASHGPAPRKQKRRA